MWEALLDRLLSGLVVRDRLTVTMPDGARRDYGPAEGLHAHFEIKDRATLRHLVINPDLALGRGLYGRAGHIAEHAP